MIASAEQIIDHFRTLDRDLILHNNENWYQGETITDWGVPGTVSVIQGVLCYVDMDVTASWLMMIVDPGFVVRYLACTYGGEQPRPWPWVWIGATDNLPACHKFVDWLILNYEVRPAEVAP